MGRCNVVKDSWDIDRLGVDLNSLQKYGVHRKSSKWKRCVWCCLYVLTRRWLKTLVFGIVMLALSWHLYYFTIHKGIPTKLIGPARVCSEQTHRRAFKRRVVWERACVNLNFPTHNDQSSPNLHFADKDKRFVYCSIPEVGDITWKQIIHFVNNASGTVGGSAVDIPRWKTSFVAPVSLEKTFGTTIRFVYSEDPYVRLWRMWVEKIYLNAYWFKSPPKFKDNREWCQADLNFTKFLSLITEKNLIEHPDRLNRHWRPQTYLCDFCFFRPTYFAKMETFEEDTRCILQMTGYRWAITDDEKHDKFLKSKSDNFGIAALKFRQASLRHMKHLIQGNLARWRARNDHKKCISERDLVLRLWHGFQLLGYLPPEANISGKFWLKREVTVEDLLLECLRGSVMRPGTSSRIRQEQREKETRKLIVEAYKAVPTQTMGRLIILYYEDFKLLNYPSKPGDLYWYRYTERDKK